MFKIEGAIMPQVDVSPRATHIPRTSTSTGSFYNGVQIDTHLVDTDLARTPCFLTVRSAK